MSRKECIDVASRCQKNYANGTLFDFFNFQGRMRFMVPNEMPESRFVRESEDRGKYYLQPFSPNYFRDEDHVCGNFQEVELDVGKQMSWEEKIEDARNTDPALAEFYESFDD